MRIEEIKYQDNQSGFKGVRLGNYVERRFSIEEDDFPYKYFSENGWFDFHQAVWDMKPDEVVLYKQRLYMYYACVEIYWNYVQTPTIHKAIKLAIQDRILQNTKEVTQWRESINDITLMKFPLCVAEILKDRKDFDSAIEYYKLSDLKEDQVREAIDKCRYERDGITYEQLRDTLRSLDQKEQMQIVAYMKIYQTELRLRTLIHERLTNLAGGTDWWNDPKIKNCKDDCIHNQEEFKKKAAYREFVEEVRLIDFTTIPQLKDLINSRWDVFESCFKDKQKFIEYMRGLGELRVEIAHARPINETDLGDLENYCKKLNRLMDTYEANHPSKS